MFSTVSHAFHHHARRANPVVSSTNPLGVNAIPLLGAVHQSIAEAAAQRRRKQAALVKPSTSVVKVQSILDHYDGPTA